MSILETVYQEGWALSVTVDPPAVDSKDPQEAVMRISSLVLLIWLVIGIAAAAQRDYFSNSDANCAKFSTTAVTIIAGPLNYVGVNPKIDCETPEPSQ
jgi:hypothetical protein